MRRSLAVAALAAAGLLTPVSAQQATSSDSAETGPLDPTWAELFPWQCIGPANMSGRFTDLAVCPADQLVVYAATASGGLLKSTDGGITYEHQFDRESTVAVGAVAVGATDPDLVWVGTGEENPRNSVSYGDGVYKSTDGGATWQRMGLEQSFQIGSIVIHPTDHDTVWVGALGRLYGPSEERGLYKTTDGGATWRKVLHVDVHTGVMEIEPHPNNPAVMLVTTYERQRDGFDTNDPAKKIGPGSALWRTTDGGETFEKVTVGMPTVQLGRIGLDWCHGDPNVVYALVETERMGMVGEDVGYAGFGSEDAEVGAKVRSVEDDGPAATAGLQEGDVILGVGGVTVLKRRQLQEALASHAPDETVELLVARGDESMTVELTLAAQPEKEGDDRPYGTRLGGQQANIQALQGGEGFQSGGLFRSDDGGESWRRVNSVDPRPMYFSQVRVDPSDPQRVYILGISGYRSSDGGETVTQDFTRGVHSDHHALWVDPQDGRHMLIGSDGGLYETRDRGDTWQHHNHMALGQFYHVAVGPRRDYWVYGGLQDNGTWGAPRRAMRGGGTVNEDWLRIGGGDGFVVQIDSEDPNQIYYESQNGGTGRTHLLSMEGGRIRPRAPRGTRYRFNWKTPFALSHHNSRIYYTSGNHVFRSLQKGDDLQPISPEITRTDRGSATAFSESPRDAGVLYVGTDDGALWGTTDGGAEWTDLLAWDDNPAGAGDPPAAPGGAAPAPAAGDDGDALPLNQLLPGPRWVSSLEASHHEDARVYVTFDAHRSDDDAPYVLVSEDHGATWRMLCDGLPRGSTRVVREDLENPEVLYLGTEFGLYVSIDRGAHWTRLHGDTLPTVAIHEIAQHRSSGEVVLGTHGRSMWVADLRGLRQLSTDLLSQPMALLEPGDVVLWQSRHRRGSSGGASRFQGENPSSAANLHVWMREDVASAELRILDGRGRAFRTMELPTKAGLHRVAWDLRGDPRAPDADEMAEMVRRYGDRARSWMRNRAPRARAGRYRVEVEVEGRVITAMLDLLEDPSAQAVDLLSALGQEYEEWLEEQQRIEEYGPVQGGR